MIFNLHHRAALASNNNMDSMNDVVFASQCSTARSITGPHYLWLHANTARMFTPPFVKSPSQKCFLPTLSVVVTPCPSHLDRLSAASQEQGATGNTKAIFRQIAEKTSLELAARPWTFLRLRKIFSAIRQ